MVILKSRVFIGSIHCKKLGVTMKETVSTAPVNSLVSIR